MLVLSRKIGQRIIVDNLFVIEILKVNGGTVRVGIEAPPEIKILRGELFDEAPNDRKPPTEPVESCRDEVM